MKEKWNYIIYLIWFSYLILSALWMFGDGFLLSRKTMSDSSQCTQLTFFNCDGKIGSGDQSCSEIDKIKVIASNPGAPMVCLSERNRVLFILVDALRYDFTVFNASVDKPLTYQNRLTVIDEMLKQRPGSTRLYQFMADPPTTTLQRIKALVTGSLPTFIDASSNFAAMELQEDNLIDQVKNRNGSIILLGDDTWARLMPKRWLRAHAQYSFHTWDLDTVDNEIDSKIYDEVVKDDWDLLIAHYLGVDHAGHRYGPNHPEMRRKLDETNRRLRKIIELLPPDVTMYVVGDHGMTETGDHGGESKMERTAALFAYRGSGLSNFESPIEVPQTDFAATLSAALCVPPPAPSLGNTELSVLPEMNMEKTLVVLTNSLKQIKQYLLRYGEESQQVSIQTLAQLINITREQIEKSASVNTEKELKQYVAEVRSLISNIRNTFREVWVEFDALSMLRALLLLILVIFFNWLMSEGIPIDRLPSIFSSTFVPNGVGSMMVCVSLCSSLYYYEVIENVRHAIFLSTGIVSGLVCFCLVALHWEGITQRWYESRMLFVDRFARFAMFLSAAMLLSNSYIIEEGASLSFLCVSVLLLCAWDVCERRALFLWLGCGSVLLISRAYRGCREEQTLCWSGQVERGESSRWALVLGLASMGSVVSIARRHIGWHGYGVLMCGLCVCAHWAVGWGSLGSPARSRLLARFAWLILATMFLLILRKGNGPILPLVVCSLLLYIANSLALGAAYAPAAFLALCVGCMTLYLLTINKNNSGNKLSGALRCNSCLSCLWALLSLYWVLGTGHHSTLGHVRWAPAFHAGDPNYIMALGPYITGLLVFLDLFGMPLLFGASVPLLVLWGKNGSSSSPRSQMAAVFTICLKFAMCFAIRVFTCALGATIHCRHLMIWGVFTPKLLFESGSCAAALIGVVIGSALTAWHLPTMNSKAS